VWQLRRLGHSGNLTLDFTGIGQPWLRELAKRWIRQRLSTGVGLEAVRRGLTALTRLAGYLHRARVDRPEEVTRVVLESYLADLSVSVPNAQRRQVHIGQLRGFLDAVRQRGWAPLDATAAMFKDDNPPRLQRGPRAVSEQVMAQLEAPAAIAAWPDPAGALITLVLIRAGLRVGDATRLSYDCLVTDPRGAPYLRYVNHKMNREALVPVDEQLAALITAQQARLTDGHAPPAVLFPRSLKNPDRATPMSTSTYRAALYRWLESLDVRDEHGHRVHLTPHQWRHTLGTRLINRDVPQEVVRRILDHDSSQMTAHYARLHDDTVRRHWDSARKVDITGATRAPQPRDPPPHRQRRHLPQPRRHHPTSSAPSSPSRPTNGPKDAATSASTSSPPPDASESPPPRRCQNPTSEPSPHNPEHEGSHDHRYTTSADLTLASSARNRCPNSGSSRCASWSAFARYACTSSRAGTGDFSHR
jgi:integrase